MSLSVVGVSKGMLPVGYCHSINIVVAATYSGPPHVIVCGWGMSLSVVGVSKGMLPVGYCHSINIVVAATYSGPPHVIVCGWGKQGHAPCRILPLHQYCSSGYILGTATCHCLWLG